MATRSSRGPTGPGGLRHPSKYSHPPPWQEQHEGSNICSSTKDFFCSTLRLRVLGYVIQQPPSFLFVISLLILTSVIPFIAVYIENAPNLPDTDEMKKWDAFLGDLSSTKLCLAKYKSSTESEVVSVCAQVPFNIKLNSADTETYGGTTLTGTLNGSSLRTKISDSYTGERIDGNVLISIFIDVPSNISSDDELEMTVNGSVVITAPVNATSKFGSISDLVKDTDGDPPAVFLPCHTVPHPSSNQLDLDIFGGTNCLSKDSQSFVQPAPEQYRHRGLVLVYLSKHDQVEGARRMKLSTIIVVGVVIAFIIGIGCTDRPAVPKAMQS